MSDVKLTAYNVKTKEKNVPIQDAVITKTAKGAYMVQGHDGKGNKLTTLCNEEKALAAINAGMAKKGWYITESRPLQERLFLFALRLQVDKLKS